MPLSSLPSAVGPTATRPRSALLPLGALITGMSLSVAGHTQTAPAATAPGAASTLRTVEVEGRTEGADGTTRGYQATTTRSTKIDQPLLDVPQSVTVITDQLIRDRAADTMKEALRNAASLTFNAGEGGRIGDNITLRGYSIVGDLYLDGLRDVAQYNREVFNLERVDVLRGSASMLFGRGSTGGIVNQVTKRPTLVNVTEATVTVGSNEYGRATVDTNQKLGENAAIRVNAMGTSANSFRDAVESRRRGLAAALGWGLGTSDEFNVSLYHLKEDNVPDLGVPFFGGRPIPVPLNRFYGLATDSQTSETNIVTASWIHRFSADTELRTVLRKAAYQRSLWAVAPRLAGGTTTLTDATVLNRQRQARGGEEDTLTSQTDLTTRFEAAGMKHQVLAGMELLREKADRWALTGAVPNPATTVGNPNPYVTLPANYFTSITRTGFASYTSNTVGLYAQDIIEFAPKWKALAGLRWDRLSADYDRPAPQGPLSRNDSVWSWRTGLMYQPTDVTTYYAAYGTSFNPSAEFYQLDNRTANTPPEKSRNIEIGWKSDLLDGDLSLRTALFRSEKTNERNTDLALPDIAVLSGRRHTQGVEVEAAGRITPNWEIFGSVAHMQSKIDEASLDQAGTQGKRPINTPSYTFSLWTTYKLGGGWRVGGGVDGAGRRYANAANTNVAPSYVRADAMLAYEQRAYTIRLNLINLFDRTVWESVYAAHVIPGARRAVQLTAQVRF